MATILPEGGRTRYVGKWHPSRTNTLRDRIGQDTWGAKQTEPKNLSYFPKDMTNIALRTITDHMSTVLFPHRPAYAVCPVTDSHT